MGFIDDKQKISDLINQAEVLGSLPKSRATSSIQSISSKSKNLLPYLLEMTNQACQDHYINPYFASVEGLGTVGTFSNAGDLNKTKKCEITRIVIEILIKFLPALVKIIKEGIVQAIIVSFNCNKDTIIPGPSYNGQPKPTVVVTPENIDLRRTLKVSPDSLGGTLIYGTDPEKDLNLKIYNLFQVANGSTNTDTWKNILDFEYVGGGDLTISINDNYVGQNFDIFMRDFINSIQIFGNSDVNKGEAVKMIINEILDSLYGTVTSNLDFGIDHLENLLEVDTLIEKIHELDPCELNSEVDDSFFEFTNEEKRRINERARAQYQGYNTVDMGCGFAKSSIKIEDLLQINENLTNAEPNKIDNVIEQSFETIAELTTFDVDPVDKPSVRFNFALNFVKEMPKRFTFVIFGTKIMVFYQVIHSLFRGVKVDVTEVNEFAFSNKVFFQFVARESLAALIEIVFEQLKREALRLVSRLAANLIAEQTDLRLAAILNITYGVTDGILQSIPTPNTSEFT